jgi:hypothetical protein
MWNFLLICNQMYRVTLCYMRAFDSMPARGGSFNSLPVAFSTNRLTSSAIEPANLRTCIT